MMVMGDDGDGSGGAGLLVLALDETSDRRI